MRNSLSRLSALAALLMIVFAGRTQDVALKSNLLYDATSTVNVGVETRLAPKWTLDVSGNLNAWRFSQGKQWRHWLLQPEARYWFCNPYAGHFVGGHLIGGQYNFGHLNMDFNMLGSDLSMLKDYRYQGWFAGLGVAYGYTWILDRHWNLEAEIGVGYAFTRYDKFECVDCGKRVESGRTHNYVGPTKAAINLVYVF